MGAFCCHGNQTKRQITIILAIFKGPYPSNILTKLGTITLMAVEEVSFESVNRRTDERQKVITIAHPEHSSGELTTTAEVVFLACDTYTGPYLCLYKIKIFQTIKKSLSAQEFGLEIYSVECKRKSTKQELSFLHVTLLRPDICPTKILPNYLRQYGSCRLYKSSARGEIST